MRIPKESVRKRVTHQLETTRRGTSEDAERRQPREVHPQTGNRRGRYKSRHGKKLTGGGGSPTGNSKGRVRSGYRKSHRERGTHLLEEEGGGTSQ